jgi:hypothetical protein
MQQQLHTAVPGLVQRLQHGSSQQQKAALAELKSLAKVNESASDAGVACLKIAQQPAILAALTHVLQTSDVCDDTEVATAAAQLLCQLAESGERSAQLIAEHPGLVAGLARLLRLSSSTAAADCAAPALVAVMHLGSTTAAASRIAAEPAVVAGLVALLKATATSYVSATAGDTAVSAAHLACNALISLGRHGGAAACLRMLQQPGVAAGLAKLIQRDQHRVTQLYTLTVLGVYSDTLSTDTSAAAQQVQQQLAGQPGIAQDVVSLLVASQQWAASSRALRRGISLAQAAVSAMRLLQFLVFSSRTTARQVLAMPAAVPALLKVVEGKSDVRRVAANIIAQITDGAPQAGPAVQ